MIVNIHESNNKKIVVICDKNLLGKKFIDKNLQLDLTSNFYNGEEKTEKEILKIFDSAYVINLVGKKSVQLALKNGLITKNNIIYIKKIPHTQAILF